MLYLPYKYLKSENIEENFADLQEICTSRAAAAVILLILQHSLSCKSKICMIFLIVDLLVLIIELSF